MVNSCDPAPVTDLEEVKSPHGSIVQPHVLTQVQSGQTEGVEVGLVREQFKETHHCSQARHSHLKCVRNLDMKDPVVLFIVHATISKRLLRFT